MSWRPYRRFRWTLWMISLRWLWNPVRGVEVQSLETFVPPDVEALCAGRGGGGCAFNCRFAFLPGKASSKTAVRDEHFGQKQRVPRAGLQAARGTLCPWLPHYIG